MNRHMNRPLYIINSHYNGKAGQPVAHTPGSLTHGTCHTASGHINMFKSAPYGGWPSPIQADMVANGSRRSTEPLFHHGYLYWIENRPQENGRAVIVRQDPTGLIADLLPSPWN